MEAVVSIPPGGTSGGEECHSLVAPFPWFGGKRRVASLVWSRFGNVDSYNEPFAGSLAVLLGRPYPPRIETVNDLDCYLANFWRALQHDPDAVARYADWPVNEADLHARHQWLSDQRAFRDRMLVDPEYFDARVAGWWVWGQCLWIGSGWCRVNSGSAGPSANSDPDLTPRHRRWQGGGQGGGSGVHAPTLVRTDSERKLREYMRRLAARLRCVRVCCGDWRRVLAPSVTTYIGTTGVLLDPPYAQDLRARCYAQDHNISAHVRGWALAHGDDPQAAHRPLRLRARTCRPHASFVDLRRLEGARWVLAIGAWT
jgi:hypothetical protein